MAEVIKSGQWSATGNQQKQAIGSFANFVFN
jgi:hypothetical protein